MSEPMEEITQSFRDTIEDGNFSRLEKRALKQKIEDYRQDKRTLDLLRHKIFELARNHAHEHGILKIIDWLETANKILLPKKSVHGVSQVYFSPGSACLEAILTALNQAIKTINLCVFTISDDRITRAIIDCHRRGIAVRIITDNDKIYDLGSDIETMLKAGIHIKTDDTSHHMHHKFAVIDGISVLTGSYNWTRSAAENNHENLMVTQDAAVVKSYQKEFNRLWADPVGFPDMRY